MTNLLHTLAVSQLRNLDPNTRLIVIHPHYRQHNLLLDELSKDPASIYVSFHHDGVALDQAELERQFELALTNQTENTSLAAASSVVLDDCDGAEEDGFDRFLVDLFKRVNGVRIVIVSRTIPPCVLADPLRAYTCFIPNDDTLMLRDYARDAVQFSNGTALLEVHGFGRGQVFLNGRSVEDWDGLLPRALFFYLVDRGMTTRSEIFATFWPTLSIKEATNVFHVTKRKISEVLGVDLTVFWTGFYCISPNLELSYDAMLFSKMIQDSDVADPQTAVELLNRSVLLYQGNYLTTMDTPWAHKRRLELLYAYGECLVGLARTMEKDQRQIDALGLYLRAAATNRQREDIVQSIMLLYREMGDTAEALHTYARLEAELESKLRVRPSPQLQALAQSMRP